MSAMAEKQLIILKHVDQTPVLAGCSGCKLKFFVPKGLMKDTFQANNYLLSKFDRHVCTGKESAAKSGRTTRHTRLQLAALARLVQWLEVVSRLN